VSFATVYIDESYSHDNSPVIVLAGFLYEREHAAMLDVERRAVLGRKKMTYMRMSEFAPGYPPFDKIPRDKRIEIETELIGIIARHRSYAFTSAISEGLLRNVFTGFFTGPYLSNEQGSGLSAYSWALMDCLQMIKLWCTKKNFDGDVSYIFEVGHRDQSLANHIMNALFLNPKNPDREKNIHESRYLSHTFADKVKVAPLQSADMLAWLSANYALRLVKGNNTPRKDLVELWKMPIPGQGNNSIFWNKDLLMQRRRLMGGVANLSKEDIARFKS